jgi:hypothetical protein
VNPDPACIGDTITFTASGVTDSGGEQRENCVVVTIPPVTPTYKWTLTIPPDYPDPLPPLSGSGASVGVVALVGGTYSATFTAKAERDCPPASHTIGTESAMVTEIPITAEVIDQDDPTNSTWSGLSEGSPIYGGSEPSTGDNVRLEVIPPAGAVSNIVWTVESPGGGTYNPPPSGPQATQWDLGDILNPVPGEITFKVEITYADGQRECGVFGSEIGVRTDDVIVVGWIDPDNVPLSTAGVIPQLLTLFPPGGPPVATGLTCDACQTMFAVAQGDANPCNIGIDAATNNANRQYLLHWMFKYAGNADPRTSPFVPGGDFRNAADTHIDNNEFVAFVASATTYKLINRFQVKYLATATGFKGTPLLVTSLTVIGATSNPLAACPLVPNPAPGQPGPNWRKLGQTAISIWQVNEGSPEASAILAFNTLMGNAVPSNPTFWESIGSRIRFRFDNGTEPIVSLQVYPTYFEYRNGRYVGRYDQLPDPQGVFILYPYPFGAVPCTGIPFPHLQGRCGEARSTEDGTARIPPFLP